ncbi:DUF4260 domain-containing protein [Serratia sp. root2]|uniref:DUF4260 domain-containing protein n=1 Tax=Serratia sp. root2 TaxID=3059676 RepID=UPI0028924DDD|nr:DUF4260 domain-containing protein [Serratia sp. root2]MDT3250785.1 DUF4260 domain-containing protein [Serratia sp. root2]
MSELTPPMRVTLRLESLLVLLLSVAVYHSQHYGWWLFAACFLIPDISFLGYAFGKKVGTIGYNLAHSYIGPALCAFAFVFSPQPYWLMTSLIWCAHIGFDRTLGYGLKYTQGFAYTHLGHLNNKRH